MNPWASAPVWTWFMKLLTFFINLGEIVHCYSKSFISAIILGYHWNWGPRNSTFHPGKNPQQNHKSAGLFNTPGVQYDCLWQLQPMNIDVPEICTWIHRFRCFVRWAELVLLISVVMLSSLRFCLTSFNYSVFTGDYTITQQCRGEICTVWYFQISRQNWAAKIGSDAKYKTTIFQKCHMNRANGIINLNLSGELRTDRITAMSRSAPELGSDQTWIRPEL